MKQTILISIFTLFSLFGFSQNKENELGLMVIDVQKFFIPNHKESIYGEFGLTHPQKSEDIINNLKNVIDWSNQHKLKTFVTFEGSDSGRFNLPDELLPLLPKAKTYHYIKTNFNALQHKEFKDEVIASGIKKWVVVGAETDVCIYQTVKGLRKLGFDVYLIKDAVYSGRINTDNALFNLEKFGVNEISSDQLSQLKAIKKTKVSLTIDDNLLVENLVLNIIEPAAIKNDTTPEKTRLKEVIKFAEELSIPVEYVKPNTPFKTAFPNKTRLIAGSITDEQYSQLKAVSKAKMIVLSDCVPDKQFADLNKNWYMITYKMLFYDILGNVNPGNSSTLQKLIKSKAINWPDYTQN